jgi:hypothetical protein
MHLVYGGKESSCFGVGEGGMMAEPLFEVRGRLWRKGIFMFSRGGGGGCDGRPVV